MPKESRDQPGFSYFRLRPMAVRTMLAAVIFGSCAISAPAAEVINGIAAEVNEEIVTTLEVSREYELRLKEEGKQPPSSPEAVNRLRAAALDALIDRKLIQQKVKEANIVIPEEEVRQAIEEIKKQNGVSQEALIAALIGQGMTFDQYKARMKEQLERLRLINQEVRAKISVSAREIRDYYDSHPAEFSEEGGYRARTIFFRLPQSATAAETREKVGRIMAVMAALRKNADFTELAKKYSDDPNVSQDGGDIGFFRKGEMLPEIERIIVTMKPGEVSDPIATPAGYHLIRLEEIRPARPIPFETVKGKIDDIIYNRKSEERYKVWTEELRKGAVITVAP